MTSKGVAGIAVSGLFLFLSTLSGQSAAATGSEHAAKGASDAGKGSGEVVAAGADSAGGALRLTASSAAVPVWIAGSAVVSAADSASAAGQTLWDASKDDTALTRPKLDNKIGVPPKPVEKPAEPAEDESPAEALKKNH